jgi:hypothetical protein
MRSMTIWTELNVKRVIHLISLFAIAAFVSSLTAESRAPARVTPTVPAPRSVNFHSHRWPSVFHQVPQNPKSVRGRVVIASAFPGADVGAKVNAADESLVNDVGEIRLSGGGAIVSQVVIGSRHTLRVMGSGTYTSNLNSAVILLKDNAQLKCDSWDPILQESTA